MGGLTEQTRLEHWRVLQIVERRLRALNGEPEAAVSEGVAESGFCDGVKASADDARRGWSAEEAAESLRCWLAIQSALKRQSPSTAAGKQAPLICALSATVECMDASLREASKGVVEEDSSLREEDTSAAGDACGKAASLRCVGFSQVLETLFGEAEEAKLLPRREESLLRRLADLLTLATTTTQSSRVAERAGLSILRCLQVSLHLGKAPRQGQAPAVEEVSFGEEFCTLVPRRVFSAVVDAAVKAKSTALAMAARGAFFRILGSLSGKANGGGDHEGTATSSEAAEAVESLRVLCLALGKALKAAQKTPPESSQLQALLSLLRRSLPVLLTLGEGTCLSAASEEGPLKVLQKSAEAVCLSLICSHSQKGAKGARVSAACLETLGCVLEKILQKKLATPQRLPSPANGASLSLNLGLPSTAPSSSLSIAAEILPSLLQRRVVEHAPFQELSAWCWACTNALTAIMRWASEAHEALRDARLEAAAEAAAKATLEGKSILEVTHQALRAADRAAAASASDEGEGVDAEKSVEEEGEDEEELRALMRKLSLGSQAPAKTLSREETRTAVCQRLLRRFLKLLKIALHRNDPTCAAASILAAKRVVQQGLATSVPTFSAVCPFVEGLLRIPHFPFHNEALELAACLAESLEGTASLQALRCSLFPGLKVLAPEKCASLDGAPAFVAAFTSVYFQEFESLILLVRNALVDAEKLQLERQRSKALKKGGRAAAAFEARWSNLLLSKAPLEAAFCAFVRVFKCQRLLKVGAAEEQQPSDAALSVQLELNLSPSRDQTFNSFISNSNAWLLPLLRRGVCRDSLTFFQEKLLPSCRALEEAASRCLSAMRFDEAQEFLLVAKQAWALTPQFLTQPLDLHATLTCSNFELVKLLLAKTTDARFRESACASLVAMAANASDFSGFPQSATLARTSPLWQDAAGGSLSCARESFNGEASSRRILELRRALQRAAQKADDSALKDASHASLLLSPKETACLPGLLFNAACGVSNAKALAHSAPHVMAFLTARFLLLNKSDRVGEEETGDVSERRREKGSLGFLSVSEKAKASQQVLNALQAFAPHCPREAMLSNVEKFVFTFVSKAKDASAGSAKSVEGISSKEMGALVELSAALAAFVVPDTGRRVFSALLELVRLCGGEGKSASSSSCEGETVLAALERKAYSALKHVIETCSALGGGEAEEAAVQEKWISRKELLEAWQTLADTRDGNSFGESRQRLTCLKTVVVRLEALNAEASLAEEEWIKVCQELLPKTTPEVLLGLRAGNGRARDGAVETLNALGRLCVSHSYAMEQLLTLVAAGLGGVNRDAKDAVGGESLHFSLMKTAALVALAHFFFAFSDEIPHRVLREIGSLGLLLLQDADRTVFKAAIGFARVRRVKGAVCIPACVFAGDMDDVARWAPEILKAFENSHAAKVRVKLRRLLLKLTRLLGEDVVEAALPSSHLPLLRSVLRSDRRQTVRQFLAKERSGEASSGQEEEEEGEAQGASRLQTRDSKRRRGERAFAEMLNEAPSSEDSSDEGFELETEQERLRCDSQEEAGAPSRLSTLLDDSDSEGLEEGKRRRGKKRSLSKSRSLCVLEDGAPLDFLSNNTLSHVLQTRGTTKDRRTEASPAGIYRSLRAKPGRLAEDAQGRIIVPFDEEGESAEETAVGFEEKEGPLKFSVGSASRAGREHARRSLLQRRRTDKSLAETTGVGVQSTKKNKDADDTPKKGLSVLAEKRRTLALRKRRVRTSGHFVEKSAEEFRASRAKGDSLKKAGVAPYAFVRLNPKAISEKFKFQTLKTLKAAVGRGAQKSKARRRVGKRR